MADAGPHRRVARILRHLYAPRAPNCSSTVAPQLAAAGEGDGRPLRELPTPLQPGQSRRVLLEEMNDAFAEGKGHVLMARYCDTSSGGSSTKNGNFWMPRVEFGGPATQPRVVDAVVLQSAMDAHRIFKRHVEKPPFYEETFIGKGVLSVGEPGAWVAQRKVLKPAFGVKALRRLLPLVWEGVGKLCDGPLARAAAAAEPVELHEALSHLAFVLIGHAALGESADWLAGRAKEMRAAFDAGLVPGHRENDPGTVAVLHEFSNRVFRRLRRARVATAATVGEEGATYRDHSVVAQLLEHHETKEESAAAAAAAADSGDGCPALCHDELMTFQFAGHETTANTMTWSVYEICRHPEVQAKLHAEIDALLPALREEAVVSGAAAPDVARTDLSWLTYRQLFKFRFLTKVINETLRLWPVVANGPFRKLEADDTVSCPHGGDTPIRLPKGTIVQVRVTHLKPRVRLHSPALAHISCVSLTTAPIQTCLPACTEPRHFSPA